MTLQIPEKNRPCHRTGSARRSSATLTASTGRAASVVKLQAPASAVAPAETRTVYRVMGRSAAPGSTYTASDLAPERSCFGRSQPEAPSPKRRPGRRSSTASPPSGRRDTETDSGSTAPALASGGIASSR
jgi:hypothetical protein